MDGEAARTEAADHGMVPRLFDTSRYGEHMSRYMLMLLLAGLFASRGVARPGPGEHQGPPPLSALVERHADELGLDVATRDALDAVIARHAESLKTAHDALRAEAAKMEGLMLSGTREAVVAQSLVMHERGGALRQAELAQLLDIRDQLDSDQWQAFRAIGPPAKGPHGSASRSPRAR